MPRGLDETVHSFRSCDNPQHFCEHLKASPLLRCEEKDDTATVIIDISVEYLKINQISVNLLYFDEYQSK